MFFCKFTSIYKSGSPKVRTRIETGAKARVKAQKTVDIEVKMLLPLIKAFKIFSASSSLLMREKL